MTGCGGRRSAVKARARRAAFGASAVTAALPASHLAANRKGVSYFVIPRAGRWRATTEVCNDGWR
jgi:hypothetical protein